MTDDPLPFRMRERTHTLINIPTRNHFSVNQTMFEHEYGPLRVASLCKLRSLAPPPPTPPVRLLPIQPAKPFTFDYESRILGDWANFLHSRVEHVERVKTAKARQIAAQQAERERREAQTLQSQIEEQLRIEEAIRLDYARRQDEERQRAEKQAKEALERARLEREQMEKEDREAWAALARRNAANDPIFWHEDNTHHTIAEVPEVYVASIVTRSQPRKPSPEDKFVEDMADFGFDQNLVRLSFHHFGMDPTKASQFVMLVQDLQNLGFDLNRCTEAAIQAELHEDRAIDFLTKA